MIDLNAMATKVAEYGFIGIVVICLAWVVVQMHKQYREDLAKKDAEIKDIQEKRIIEGRESLNALSNSTNVLNDLLAQLASRKAE